LSSFGFGFELKKENSSPFRCQLLWECAFLNFGKPINGTHAQTMSKLCIFATRQVIDSFLK